MISFDQILEKRIGTGVYQGKAVATTGLIEFCDGMIFTLMSILLTVLQTEWNLTKSELSFMGSSFLFGILAGNLVCAFVADRIGRKSTMSILTGLTVFIIYLSSFTESYIEMVILRFFFGVVYGTTYPLGYVITTESTEAKYRGRFSNFISLLYILGRIYLVCLCILYLEDYKSGNWRGLIRQNGIPAIISFLLSLFCIKETVRYYLKTGQYQTAFREIENIIQTNGQDDYQLQDEEKNGLIQWSEKQKQEHQEQQLHLYGITSKQYIKVTLILWVQYALVNFQNMSIYLLMPFVFSKNEFSFLPMLYMYLGEFCLALVMHHFIDNSEYGGRQRIIGYSAATLIISNGLIYFYRERFIIIGLLIVKLCIRGLLSTLGIVCCESYPLQLRSQGVGVAQAVGKIITIPSPYILFQLYFIDPYLPFLLMLILATIIFTVDCCCFTEDKTQKHLESLNE